MLIVLKSHKKPLSIRKTPVDKPNNKKWTTLKLKKLLR